MTPNERNESHDLSFNRRKRIASGSGTKIDDVNRLVKGFKRIKQLLKNMPLKGNSLDLLNKNSNSKFGGNLWH
jgi:signal recognition particle GTPase